MTLPRMGELGRSVAMATRSNCRAALCLPMEPSGRPLASRASPPKTGSLARTWQATASSCRKTSRWCSENGPSQLDGSSGRQHFSSLDREALVMVWKPSIGGLALVLALAHCAQAETISKSVPSGQSSKIDHFTGWNDDCSFKSLNIDIVSKPSHGRPA